MVQNVSSQSVVINWARIYNRLFEIINKQGATYFSGGRYIASTREIDPYFPDYSQYIEQRQVMKKSTSRKDYFYDILMSFSETARAKFILTILDQVADEVPDMAAGLRDELGGKVGVPLPDMTAVGWNTDRLQAYLADIDARISVGKYAGAVTLCYTCAEGFFKAFLRSNLQSDPGPLEIVAAGRAVQQHLRDTIPSYPDEALRMINHICHTLDRTRNRFSESHYDEEATIWLAMFMRDLTNSVIRLLLHFIRRTEAEPIVADNTKSKRS